MAWEENSCICLNMQLIAILSRIGVYYFLDNDGSIKAYWPSRDEPDSQIPCISTDIKSKRNSIILRGFTTITFIE